MSGRSLPFSQVLVRVHLLASAHISCRHYKRLLSSRVEVLHVGGVSNAHDRLKLVVLARSLGLLVVRFGPPGCLLHFLGALVSLLLFLE